MMRFSGRFWAFAATAVIFAVVSQVALAQNERGRRGRGGREGGAGGPGGPVTMARLATLDQVQDALKLTDEQKDKIKQINDDMRKEMRTSVQQGGRPDREKIRKMMESTSGKINEVLDEGQRKRLMGILIQVNGAAAVMDPAIAKELNLTDEQRTKLHESMRGMRESRGENGSPEEMHAKMDKAVMAVLTDEQQKTLESLKGEKVDIDMSKLRAAGGGGRPGRNRAKRGSDQSKESKSSS